MRSHRFTSPQKSRTRNAGRRGVAALVLDDEAVGDEAGEGLPDRGRAHAVGVLTMGERRLLLRRTDAWTLELSAAGQALLDQPQEVLFRPPPQALQPADTADVGLFRATVLQDRPGVGIGTVQFRFDRPLEHAALVFLAGGPEGLEPFELPAVGKAVMVPAPVLPEDPPG